MILEIEGDRGKIKLSLPQKCSVLDIKRAILSKEKIPIQAQKIVYGGLPLRDEQEIQIGTLQYNLELESSEGNSPAKKKQKVSESPSDEFNLRLSVMTYWNKYFLLEKKNTIGTLKSKVSMKEGFPVEAMTVLLEKEVKDAAGNTAKKFLEVKDDETFLQNGVSSESKVLVQIATPPKPLTFSLTFLYSIKEFGFNSHERNEVKVKDMEVKMEIDASLRVSGLGEAMRAANVKPPATEFICVFSDMVMNEDETFEEHGIKDGDKIYLIAGFYRKKKPINN